MEGKAASRTTDLCTFLLGEADKEVRLEGSRETGRPQKGPATGSPKIHVHEKPAVVLSSCSVELWPKDLRMPLQETSGDTHIKSDTCSSACVGYLGMATLGERHCFWFGSTTAVTVFIESSLFAGQGKTQLLPACFPERRLHSLFLPQTLRWILEHNYPEVLGFE